MSGRDKVYTAGYLSGEADTTIRVERRFLSDPEYLIQLVSQHPAVRWRMCQTLLEFRDTFQIAQEHINDPTWIPSMDEDGDPT